MPLKLSSGDPVYYMNFNQDYTCLSIADAKGIKIWSLSTHKLCYVADIGAVSIAEMLECTSLMAFVGAGEQPALTPRKLTLMNTTIQSVIQDISFQTSILAVRLNRKRLVVVLDQRVNVYALETLEKLCTLETAANPKGVCALTNCPEPNLVALPASATAGTICIYNLLATGVNVLCEVEAHRTPVSVMAWNHDGSLLASASQKGTVIRVFRLPEVSKAYTFRRGTTTSTIHSLAFSPPSVKPSLLCAASAHGTVHLFLLEESVGSPTAVRTASGLLANVIPSVSDAVDPPRSIITLRLPCQAVASICAIAPTDSHRRGSKEWEGGSVTIIVATAQGTLFQYAVHNLQGPQAPSCALEQEYFLLRNAM
ncbi:g1099 [Coccomyxa viridis]|uniref:G1099 protein n=1 Tax=Coccomyxa viridis TaxID=1274662 RepID=A0ABP1FH81_9CHLO